MLTSSFSAGNYHITTPELLLDQQLLRCNGRTFKVTYPHPGLFGKLSFLKVPGCSLASFTPRPIHENTDNVRSANGATSASDPSELLHRLAAIRDTSGISQFVDCHGFAFTFLENQSQESKARFSLSTSMPLFSMYWLMMGCNNQ